MNPNNYVVNPRTNRYIRKGGKVYNKLLKEGIIEADLQSDNPQNLKSKLRSRRGPKQAEVVDFAAKSAVNTFQKNYSNFKERLEECYDENDELDENTLKELEKEMKNLILEDMLDGYKKPDLAKNYQTEYEVVSDSE